jgi:DNA repair exonuclease SbcCD ATPase subunit
MDKLVTLFTRIHLPHEFSDVQFNGEVKLKRQSGSISPVREISTGQRAALALSIFLSMNSSVSVRAPWLLFDDPIAHVDDLNILSFLDILRDLVFLGDRQVFFATANRRLADLFTRKFDCLGTDFKDTLRTFH